MKKVIHPWYRSKRFYLNLIVGLMAAVDYMTGWIREILPGKEGAIVLIVFTIINVALQTHNNRRMKTYIRKIERIDKADDYY